MESTKTDYVESKLHRGKQCLFVDGRKIPEAQAILFDLHAGSIVTYMLSDEVPEILDKSRGLQ